MPLYMDRHEVDDSITPFDIAQAHARDLEVQAKYGVDYITYWFDHQTGAGFCLVEGPSADVVEAVHREAHGMVGTKVIEVDRAAVESFLGHLDRPVTGEALVATAFRAILFTDLVDSTELTQRLGDAGAMRVIRAHDAIVNDAIRRGGGQRVKHTGDGVMASFTSVSRAVETAIAIQRAVTERSRSDEVPFEIRVPSVPESQSPKATTSSALPFSSRRGCARRASAVACWCRALCASYAWARVFSSRTRDLSKSRVSTSRYTSTR